MEQDSLYGVCAHASIWMVALYHHLAHGTPRRLLSKHPHRCRVAPGVLQVTPSDGLSERQVGAALQHIGLDAIQYSLTELGPRSSIAATACRYLNSRMPVILTTRGHVTVLIGYGRDRDGRLFYVRSDESKGPYRRVYKVDDLLGDWQLLLVPVPGKIYLGGESAEIRARTIFRNLLLDERRRQRRIPPSALRLRSYVTRAGDYKVRMQQRGLDAPLRDILRFVGTSTWIWVVELQDPSVAGSSPQCVLGEVAFDATSSNLAPGPLFGHLRDKAYVWLDPRKYTVQDGAPYLSATAVHDVPEAEPGHRGLVVRLRSRGRRALGARLST